MFSQRKGRDVYVLGSANVGKSTFIRAALKAMREQGNFFVPGKRLPTASAMPGTTLAGSLARPHSPFTPRLSFNSFDFEPFTFDIPVRRAYSPPRSSLKSQVNTCANRLWAPGVLCTSTLCKRGGVNVV